MSQREFNLKIEDSACVKCGACITSYPDIFRFNENGDVEIFNAVKPENISAVKESCPVGAIVDNK